MAKKKKAVVKKAKSAKKQTKKQAKKTSTTKAKTLIKKSAAAKKKPVSKKPSKTRAAKPSVPAKKKKAVKKPALSQRKNKIQEIKKSLLSQKNALLREAEEALNNLPGDLNFPDMGDQATAETDRNFMLRLRDRERMLLKKIEETIERIDNAEYGICTSCGNEIGIKRLEARPVTDLCIECKVRQEEEEKIVEG
ncbi:MAG: RNA polymerase-binding protein DksA [Nitrospirae bacterium]|nr:RNA polymerase-binding protein DksA [Nitrospirota bacterium]